MTWHFDRLSFNPSSNAHLLITKRSLFMGLQTFVLNGQISADEIILSKMLLIKVKKWSDLRLLLVKLLILRPSILRALYSPWFETYRSLGSFWARKKVGQWNPWSQPLSQCVCVVVSKAFAKSSNIILTGIFCFQKIVQSPHTTSRLDARDLRFLNPCWVSWRMLFFFMYSFIWPLISLFLPSKILRVTRLFYNRPRVFYPHPCILRRVVFHSLGVGVKPVSGRRDHITECWWIMNKFRIIGWMLSHLFDFFECRDFCLHNTNPEVS